jgi:hypothetical protein
VWKYGNVVLVPGQDIRKKLLDKALGILTDNTSNNTTHIYLQFFKKVLLIVV